MNELRSGPVTTVSSPGEVGERAAPAQQVSTGGVLVVPTCHTGGLVSWQGRSKSGLAPKKYVEGFLHALIDVLRTESRQSCGRVRRDRVVARETGATGRSFNRLPPSVAARSSLSENRLRRRGLVGVVGFSLAFGRGTRLLPEGTPGPFQPERSLFRAPACRCWR